MNRSGTRRYAIVASKLWDGVADQAVQGMAVIVNDGKIESLCPTAALPSDIERVMFGETSVVLPGLIDAHIHYSPWMGPAFLAAGVTTVRDTGNNVDWLFNQRESNCTNVSAGPEIIP